MSEVQILTLSCRDKPGITAKVSGFLYENGGNILEAQQFNDQGQGSFLLRVEFDPNGTDTEGIRDGFASIAAEYRMTWKLTAGILCAMCCCWFRNSTTAWVTCSIVTGSASCRCSRILTPTTSLAVPNAISGSAEAYTRAWAPCWRAWRRK